MRSRALVAAVGARTALGLTATQTALLLRTGVTALGAAPLVDGAGQQVTMGFDATQDPYLVGPERAARLASFALRDALTPLGPAVQGLSAQLLLCLDEGGGARAPDAALLAARVHAAARDLLPGAALEISARGAAGPAHALPKALEALEARRVDAVLLGGVHSDYDPLRIAALDEAGRLFSAERLDGLIPGEAAAFALLVRDDVARRADLPGRARVRDLGAGMERARPDNDETPYEAYGLTTAIRAASDEAQKAGLRVGWSISDLSFELWRIKEWQAVITRTHAVWGEPQVMEAPAQRLGNLGAAAMPLGIALAAEAWRRGHAPAPLAMVFAGSDSGERGAILLSEAGAV